VGVTQVRINMNKFKQESGLFVRKKECPKCTSEGRDRKGDNFAIYKQEDGSYDGTCFSCGFYSRCDSGGSLSSSHDEHDTIEVQTLKPTDNIEQMPSITLLDRNIKQDVTSFYGVKSEVVDGKEIARYYPVTKSGKRTGYKKRILPKDFGAVGDTRDCDMFGQSKFASGGRLLIITEGEEDALATYRICAYKSPKKTGYPTVSIPTGINNAVKTIKKHLEWVESFDKVVFAFDQEEDALAIAKECASLLEPGKGHVARFSEKDASAMCTSSPGKFTELYNAIWQAEKITPDGLVTSSSTWDAWKNRNNYQSVPLPTEWGLDKILGGIRIGGLYTVGAGTGVGKSTLFKILQLNLWRKTDDNIGVIALEEPLCDSIGMLMGLYLNKRIHIEESVVSEEEELRAWTTLFGDDRFIFEQAFGALNDDAMIRKIRFMVNGQGCRYIFLDHLTALTDMYGDGKGSKVEQTARLVAKLKNLTQELDCAIIMISHLRKRGDDARSYEEGAVPGLDSLYGAAAIKQYSDAVISIARDQRTDPSVTTYHVLKNRLSGRLGKGNLLVYNYTTGWMEEGVMEGDNVL
jgi:twinkle protein